MLILLLVFCVASLAGNVILFFLLRKSKKAPAPTLEAKAVLAEILQGQAIIQMKVLDPENLMLRSPRR